MFKKKKNYIKFFSALNEFLTNDNTFHKKKIIKKKIK